MFTAEQLSVIREAMEEEHRLDRLALERLSRYLPRQTQRTTGQAPVAKISPNVLAKSSFGGESSQLELVKSILKQNPNRTWTIRTVLEEVHRRGASIDAKYPTVSISSALKKLSDRGVISLVRKGAGREPSIYQFGKISDGEGDTPEEN